MPLSAGLYYYFHDGGQTTRPPMILLHGAGGDHLVWPPEIRRLTGIRIYALDLPGHGKSDGAGKQSAEDYARSVVDFMDAAGLWRAVFVGHSLGGAIALILALEYPERTAGLVLVSSGACLSVPETILENAASASAFIFAVQRLHNLSCSPHSPPRLIDQNFKRLSNIRPTLLHGDLLACARFDVTDRLASIRKPVLVICGTEDQLTPLHYSATLATQIPGAALQTVDEAGHLLILEQPQRVAKPLSVFLATISYIPGE